MDLLYLSMRFKIIISFIFLPLFSFSQTEIDSFLEATRQQLFQARQEIKIINNKNKVLPFTRIDTLKIGFFSNEQRPGFKQMLENYLPIQKLENLDELNIYDYIIVEWNLDKSMGKTPKFLDTVPNLIMFTKSRGELDLDRRFDHHLHANNQSPLLSSLAAQGIFGAVLILGKNNQDPLKPIGRLGYTSPEEFGIFSFPLQENIKKVVEEGIEAQAFPGAQVLVAYKNKVIYHEAYGYHTYSKNRKVQKTDIYDLASITKVSGALPALMKFHGEGKFDIDLPMSYYFQFLKDSNKGDALVKEVLSHYARYKAWIPYWRTTLKKNGKYKRKTLKAKPNKKYSIQLTPNLYLYKDYKQEIYKQIKEAPIEKELKYLYSGLSFYLWPDLVASISGMDYETYLKETFYNKLGAKTLTYKPLRYFSKDRIIPTENDTFFRKELLHGVVHDEGAAMMDGISSNAGLFSSANDLAKLFQMYLNKGSYAGEQFIAPNSISTFTKTHYAGANNRRGLGFDKPLLKYDPVQSSTAKDASLNSFGHSGYTGTFVWADPDNDLIYIFFSNRVYPTRYNRKIYQMNIRPRIQQTIYDAILKK